MEMVEGVTRAEVASTRTLLDPNILTIGFARRAASYKRATLLLSYEYTDRGGSRRPDPKRSRS